MGGVGREEAGLGERLWLTGRAHTQAGVKAGLSPSGWKPDPCASHLGQSPASVLLLDGRHASQPGPSVESMRRTEEAWVKGQCQKKEKKTVVLFVYLLTSVRRVTGVCVCFGGGGFRETPQGHNK